MTAKTYPAYFAQFSDDQLKTFYRNARALALSKASGYTAKEYDDDSVTAVRFLVRKHKRQSVNFAWVAASDVADRTNSWSEQLQAFAVAMNS